MEMDDKKEFELDVTMETRSRYKLRSSLKKVKSRNSLEAEEVNSDITLNPPPRRVSFASSNYIKPFIDDPERNTIWDNTYEEEVDHIDSTKSEASSLKTQSITFERIRTETIQTNEQKITNKTVIFDQSAMDLEYTLEPQSILKKTKETYEQSALAMEMTCNWTNKIVESSKFWKEETVSNKENIFVNFVVNQQPLNKIPDFSQQQQTNQSSVHTEFQCNNGNNAILNQNRTIMNDTEMEFTCKYNFPTNIISKEPVECSADKGEEFQWSSMELTCQYNFVPLVNSETVPLKNKESDIKEMEQSVFKEPFLTTSKKQNSMNKSQNKPIKIQTFGGIPIAVDLSNQSTESLLERSANDQNVKKVMTIDENKSIDLSSRNIVNVKPVGQQELVKLRTFGGIPIAVDLSNQSTESLLEQSARDTNIKKIMIIEDEKSKDLSSKNDTNDKHVLQQIKSRTFGGIPIAVDQSNQSTESLLEQSAKDTIIKKIMIIDNKNKDLSSKNDTNCQHDLQQVKSTTFGGIPIAVDQSIQSTEPLLERSANNQSIKKLMTFEDNKSIDLSSKNDTNYQHDLQQVKSTAFGGIPIAVDQSNQSTELLLEQSAKDTNTKKIMIIDDKNKDLSAKNDINDKHVLQQVKLRTFGGIPIAVDQSNQSTELLMERSANNQSIKKVMTFKDNKSKDLCSKNNTNDKHVLQQVKLRTFGGIPIATDVSDMSMDLTRGTNQNSLHGIDKKTGLHESNMGMSQKPDGVYMSGSIPIATDQPDESPDFTLKKKEQFVELVSEENSKDKVCLEQPNSLLTNIMSSSKVDDKDRNRTTSIIVTHFDGTNNENYNNEYIIENESKLLCSHLPLEENKTFLDSLARDNLNQLSLDMEECNLVDTLSSSNESESKHFACQLSCNGGDRTEPELPLPKDFSVNDTGTNFQNSFNKIGNKVAYSVPMGVVKGSGLDLLNFNSMYSAEDTQQLIEAASSSDPPFQSIDGDRAEAPHMSGNVSITQPNDTFSRTQSILNDIENKVMIFKFPPIDYEGIMSKLKESQRFRADIGTALKGLRSIDVSDFDLEKRRRSSIPNSTGNEMTSNSNSFTEMTESGDDGNSSSIMEHMKSLEQRVKEVCARSNGLLSLYHSVNNCYILETLRGLIQIFVRVHPEDSRVAEIEFDSCVCESAATIIHFKVHNIKQKLEPVNLKSYLGSYYDILSLLDYVCLTVEDFERFHSEFIKLQRKHATLKIEKDLSISFEVLNASPPVWWTIRFGMSSTNKILFESAQSRYGNINEEHIKQISRDVPEDLSCLGNFVDKVAEYCKRTLVGLKNLKRI